MEHIAKKVKIVSGKYTGFYGVIIAYNNMWFTVACTCINCDPMYEHLIKVRQKEIMEVRIVETKKLVRLGG